MNRAPETYQRNINMAGTGKKPPLNDEIQSITLYNIRHTALHGYVMPFVIIYTCWLYTFTFHYEMNEYAFISLAGLGLCHILVSLFSLWFVHVYCLLACNEVGFHC